MKKLFFAILLTIISMSAFAQRQGPNGTAEDRAKRQTASLNERLKLSDEQQKQIYELNLNRTKKMDEMRKAENQDRESMRASMQEYEKALEKVLTPEQLKQHKADQEERFKDRPRRN